MSESNYTIFCLFIHSDGAPDGEPFEIKIPSDQYVDDLKDSILAENPNIKAAAFELTLWKFKEPTAWESLGSGLRNNLIQLDDCAERLNPIFELSDYFSPTDQNPDPLPEKSVHVVVLTTPGIGQRRYKPGFEYYDRRKESELYKATLSKLNNSAVYSSIQSKEYEKILDNRPQVDKGIPPLELLYPRFGVFTDSLQRTPKYDIVARSELKTLVDKLADTMCEIDSGHLKWFVMRDTLDSILSMALPEPSPESPLLPIYGHVLGFHDGPVVIIEYESELAMIEPRLAASYYRLVVNAKEKVYKSWRLPCLGILIRGPFISFQGLVLLDNQVRSLSLTDPLLCIKRTPKDGDRQLLYTAFNAALDLIEGIGMDAKEYVEKYNSLREIPGPERCFPSITSLSLNDGKNGSRIEFRILGYFGPRSDMRYLYEAERMDSSSSREKIVVKFTQSYGDDLHRFCAERRSERFAPKLLGFERLAGGWCGVAMEYISWSWPSILESPLLAKHGKEWISQMEDMVKVIHDAGFVHGDLRDPNFMVDGERVVLVDFDWGGKWLEARFPDVDLVSVLREDRMEELITKERDLKVLRCTIALMNERIDEEMVKQGNRYANLTPDEQALKRRRIG